jgi:hypothetical protein
LIGDEMKVLRNLTIIMIIVTILGLCGCKQETATIEESSVTSVDDNSFCGKVFPIYLREAIQVMDAFRYTGVFPEDGSFTQKENVFALKVKNNSVKDLQLVRIDVVTESGKEFFFEATSLPAGKVTTVYEKNGATITENEIIKSITDRNIAFFQEKMSLHSDVFEIFPMNGVMNIVNISNQDITSDVYVYYKKVDGVGGYFGGVTFRSNVGPIKAGELKQIAASSYNPVDSKVVFVSYVSE